MGSKKLPRHARSPHSPSAQNRTNCTVVSRRSPTGSKEWSGAALGEDWNKTAIACGSTVSERLSVWSNLSSTGDRRCLGSTKSQHQGNAVASRRDQSTCRSKSTCGRDHGPSRMAHDRETCCSAKLDDHSIALKSAGVEPGRECLAIFAGNLSLKPCFRHL